MPTNDLIVVAVVALVGACVQFLTGFGFSLTTVPLLALAIDTRTASMLAAILALTTSSAQAWLGRRHTVWPVVGRMCLWAAFGMPLGLWLFTDASERGLKLFLGISTLVLVGLLIRGIDVSRVGGTVDVVAGFVAGVLTTSINTNGPPLVFVLQARRLSAASFRATITTIFVSVGLVGLALRVWKGGMTHKVWSGLAVAPPSMLIGGLTGFRLRPHIDGPRFARAVQLLLVLAALSAIAAAL